MSSNTSSDKSDATFSTEKSVPSAAILALIANGPTTISIANTRTHPNASPHRPSFLHGISASSISPDKWTHQILPYISTLTFDIASNPDIHFFGQMLASPNLPGLYSSITKLSFSGNHWFSGILFNRRCNPYLNLATLLPSLRVLAFTVHTAGITEPLCKERYMLGVARADSLGMKMRRVMSLESVVRQYGFDVLFACATLENIRIDYVESRMTLHHCPHGNPWTVVMELQAFLVSGFLKKGMNVHVNIQKV